MVLLFSFFIPAIVFTEIHGQSPRGPTEGGSGSATAWTAAATTAVVGWLVSPVITLLLPKIISCLGFDASEKLEQLQIHIVPELQNTLSTVDQERMMQRGKRKKSEVAILDKMALMLRHAQEDAEDILDDAQEIELYRNRWWAWWQDILCDAIKACILVVAVIRCVGIFCHDKLKHRLYGAVATCKTSFMRLLHSARKIAALPWSEEDVLPTRRSDAPSGDTFPVARRSHAASDDTILAASLAGASDETPAPVATPSDSSGCLLSCLCSFFDLIKNSLRFAVWFAYFLRDWTYEVVGITDYQENATALDFFVTIISRRNLKKRIEKVESTVSEVKKSPLISEASKSAQEDIANKNRSRIRIASNHKVFGREALRESIMEKLRETPHSDAPSSSASPCYSVIGIYGVAGSGKTTFARYIRDYIEEECKEKLFDTIMCIHVSETFSVDDIFHDMLKDITKKRQSDISDPEELKEKLEESLRGKRFFLILDDLWVNTKNDRQLEELISPLNVGLKGSKILVTAQTKVAAGALCIDEPKEIPDLDEDQYFSMFMHYAGGTSADDTEFKRVGRVIAEKLHGSPIAAVIVAGRLGANRDIGFWKNTAELDMLNDTMDALWWSYQHLSMDIRRCFEYCNIFPRRFKMKKRKLSPPMDSAWVCKIQLCKRGHGRCSRGIHSRVSLILISSTRRN